MGVQVEVTKDFVFNSIAMDNTGSDVNIIVEGATDASLLFGFTDESCCNIYYMKKRDNVLELMSKLEAEGKLNNTVAIIDRDQEDIFPQTDLPANTFYTDTNDIETMILYSESFYRIAGQIFPITKCPDRAAIDGIRNLLIERALPIGELRIVDKRNGWNLSYKKKEKKDLEFKNFIDKRTFVYKGDKALIDAIKAFSVRPDVNTPEAVTGLSALRAEGHDPLKIIVGHDVTRVIALAFKQFLHKEETEGLENEQVEITFRAAYNKNDFIATNLANNMINALTHLNINFFAL